MKKSKYTELAGSATFHFDASNAAYTTFVHILLISGNLKSSGLTKPYVALISRGNGSAGTFWWKLWEKTQKMKGII